MTADKPLKHSVDIPLTSGEVGNADVSDVCEAFSKKLGALTDKEIDTLAFSVFLQFILRGLSDEDQANTDQDNNDDN